MTRGRQGKGPTLLPDLDETGDRPEVRQARFWKSAAEAKCCEALTQLAHAPHAMPQGGRVPARGRTASN